jgi:hypothetical protein
MYGTSKLELIQMIMRLKKDVPEAILDCISFFCDESKGMWHNRARARIARNLRIEMLNSKEKSRIVEVIIRRLADGNFSEQFSDQLDLALKLNRDAILAAAKKGRTHPRDFIRRKSEWIIARHERITKSKRAE